MKYALYCIAVFTIIYGALAIWLGAARTSYRKRFGK